MKKFTIKNKVANEQSPVFIIAEAGVNHNGSLKTAKKMVDAAKKAGVDAIKFQTFRAEELVTKNAKKARYQQQGSSERSQYQMLKKLELSDKAFISLNKYCQKKKIMFLSSPFDVQSAQFLNSLGAAAFKIPSGELTNTPFIKAIAAFGKPIILSTGMADLQEVRQAVKVIKSTGNQQLVLLHCTSNYPAKHETVNLKAMLTLKNAFDLPVGYSDHTQGNEVAIAATALGAKVLEKHFTLSKKMKGPDHLASAEPAELAALVQAVRNVEVAMGSGIKKPYPSEAEIKSVARKSIVAATFIPKGSRLTQDMLAVKRPGHGISPNDLPRIINKKTKNNYKKDQLLSWKQLQQ